MSDIAKINGRIWSNTNFIEVAPLITVTQLRERYLFGVNIKTDEGRDMSDDILQEYINIAVSQLEHDLDLAIMPRQIEEHKDYNANDYWDWGYMQLNRYPVISVESLNVVYLKDAQGNFESVMDIPPEWLRLDNATGIIRMIPNNKFPARLQVDSMGAFFPELFRRHSMVPSLWQVKYTHGFKPGCIPVLVNHAVGLLASLFALSIAGHLILGAGIAGFALSLDGMSQSINTTASAEYSGFSATRREFMDSLFGKAENDPNAVIKILRRYYKGSQLQII